MTDSGMSSIKETYIITPADKPRAADRKRVFVFCVRKAIRLPMPVESPAIKVSPNAQRISWFSILHIVLGERLPLVEAFRPDFAQHAAPVRGNVAYRCGIAFPLGGEVFQNVGTRSGEVFLLARVRPQVVELPLLAVAVRR